MSKSISNSILFGMIYNKGSLFNKCARKRIGLTVLSSPHGLSLITDVIKNRGKLKKYLVTDNTMKRIEKVPIDEKVFTKGFFNHLSKSVDEVGIVSLTDKLHFIYSIDGLSVKISVCRGVYKKQDNVESFLQKSFKGFIYIDLLSEDSFINFHINNVLDIINNNDHLLMHESDTIKISNKMSKDPDYNNLYQLDYKQKHNDVSLCLKCFIFIKFAKVYDETLISLEQSIKKKYNLFSKMSDIIKIDSFWDKNIKSINPFNVDGHFRNQAHGKGLSKRKIIYIDSFMKNGYSRKATILKK